MAQQPDIHVAPKLQEFLQRKGYAGVVVDTAQASSCGGAIAEVYAFPAKEAKLAKLVAEGARAFEACGVRVVVAKHFLKCDEHVELDLKRILAITDIRVEGIHM